MSVQHSRHYQQPLSKKPSPKPLHPFSKNSTRYLSQELKTNKIKRSENKRYSPINNWDKQNQRTAHFKQGSIFYAPDITNYWGIKQNAFYITDKNFRSSQGSDKEVMNKLSLNTSYNLYTENKERKMKKILQKQMIKSPEKNIEEISQQSFRIKEIKPTNKVKAHFNNPNHSESPSFGQSHRSYYQVVALQKKFNNSKYFETDNWFNKNKSDYLEQRYQSQIKNPERLVNISTKKTQKKMKGCEESPLEPWNNNYQNANQFE